MKTPLQSGSSARVPVPPEKRFLISFQNDRITYRLSEDGVNAALVENRTGKDWIIPSPAAFIRRDGTVWPSTAALRDGDGIRLHFAGTKVEARLRIAVLSRHLIVEVAGLEGAGVDEFTFADIRLRQDVQPDGFVATALALDLQTRVLEMPGPLSRLRATSYARFGFSGARVAIIGGARGELRSILQDVVSAAPDLPKSALGGPWALDAPVNRGSYLFNFDGITGQSVDAWIELAKSLGFTQIDFHGGRSHRFGDCRPDPQLYPKGRKSLKAVVDRLHAAGIAAGLHTYSFFIAKDCPWVTPVPDRRLGTDAVFTLRTDVTAGSTALPVRETTADMSTVTGFCVRNSVTLRIDDELVTYDGVNHSPPWGFTSCKRGALGTRAEPHARGARVHHLKELYGLFAPDGDSDLLYEVASCTAATFNECGFDMIYLDALDGEDVLAGEAYGWHYGSKFVFDLWRRLRKPALQEMATFHHHLWNVRSRIGAWDHPTRGYKRFIDNHCASNHHDARMHLPGHLGWWAILPWQGSHQEPTYPDDIEYLCCKALGTDAGISLMGIDPGSATANPAMGRLAKIIRTYEGLRHSRQVPESIKARLRERGQEFTLIRARGGGWRFRPVRCERHKVEGCDERTSAWQVCNPFAVQPVRLRIEALQSVARYDAAEGVVLADFSMPEDFTRRAAAAGMRTDLQSSNESARTGMRSGQIGAWNDQAPRIISWTQIGRTFSPPLNLTTPPPGVHPEARASMQGRGDRRGFGVWVQGDGQGQLLNFQIRSPVALSNAVEDHYVDIDFNGWRYFELVEPESVRVQDFRWPYAPPQAADAGEGEGDAPVHHGVSGTYPIYRESTVHAQIENFDVWFNNVPPGSTVACRLSPFKSLPLSNTTLVHPVVTVNGLELTFPVKMTSGQYIELDGSGDCRLFGPDGSPQRQFRPHGMIPKLAAGANVLGFACKSEPDGVAARARVTVMLQGKALRGWRAPPGTHSAEPDLRK